MRLRLWAVPLALPILIAGCSEEKVTKPGAKTAAKKPADEEQIKTRETINRKTQLVLKLPEALAQGGVLAATNIPVADPLTQNAAAYRTSVAKIGAMQIEQAIQLRNAQ